MTGVVVEISAHEKVVVKVDGSRQLTLRNRRFIRGRPRIGWER
jgi:hypothetical protein